MANKNNYKFFIDDQIFNDFFKKNNLSYRKIDKLFGKELSSRSLNRYVKQNQIPFRAVMVLCDNFKVHPRELGIRKNLNEDSFFIENYIKEF